MYPEKNHYNSDQCTPSISGYNYSCRIAHSVFT